MVVHCIPLHFSYPQVAVGNFQQVMSARKSFLCSADQSLSEVALLTFSVRLFVGVVGEYLVHYRVFGSISGLFLLDARSTPSLHSDNPKCLQTLQKLSESWGDGHSQPWLRTFAHTGWHPGVVFVPQNYSFNEQARTIVISKSKDNNKTAEARIKCLQF